MWEFSTPRNGNSYFVRNMTPYVPASGDYFLLFFYKGIPTKDSLCSKHEWKKGRFFASPTYFCLCGKVDILKNSLDVNFLGDK